MKLPNHFPRKIMKLHEKISNQASKLTKLNSKRINCKLGCSGCCIDNITVYKVESTPIIANYKALLKTGVPHKLGKCAFLDQTGACRIYEHRPYVCRTQGLPLRWREADLGSGEEEDEEFEFRDICKLNDLPVDGEFPTIVELPEEYCWSIGKFEFLLSELQREFQGCTEKEDGGEVLERVKLRDLFVNNV